MFPLKLGSELQKNPIHYEDISKIQTEFSQSGMHKVHVFAGCTQFVYATIMAR